MALLVIDICGFAGLSRLRPWQVVMASPSEHQKSEMVEYLQGQFREEEIANKVEFASCLKQRSELIEAASPKHIKSIVLLNKIFQEKPLSMQAAFT